MWWEPAAPRPPRFLGLALASAIAALPQAARAGGLCESDDGALAVALTLASDGAVLDLAVTEGDSRIFRYPDANGTGVRLAGRQYRFASPAAQGRPALGLDLAGGRGSLRWRGKGVAVECTWD